MCSLYSLLVQYVHMNINIDSGNGLLPDGTMPLPETMNADLSSVRSSDNHLRAIL